MNRAPKRVLVVDGYNVINARGRVAGAEALAEARDDLLLRLQDYAGYSGQHIVLVFDAWMSDRTARTVERNAPVDVVFTQKGETADHYIERFCDEHAADVEYRRIELRVATSDLLEQTIIMGRGASRISSRELLMEMEQVRKGGAAKAAQTVSKRSRVEDRIPPETLAKLREMAREPEKEKKRRKK